METLERLEADVRDITPRPLRDYLYAPGATEEALTDTAIAQPAMFAVGMAVAAWPGWLHAPASCWWDSAKVHPALVRRVEWRIDADPEMKRNAEWLQESRQSGQLPAEARGIMASVDLANYCAWFAPDEKVFVNGRFKHHRSELKDLTQLRRGLGVFQEKAEAPDFREVAEVMARWQASYVGIAILQTDADRRLVYHTPYPLRDVWLNWTNWSPWFVNGRTTIAGYRASTKVGDATFAKLELSPEVIAYGRDVKPVPSVKCEPPFVPQGSLDELLRPRRPTPAGAEEALAWLAYKDRQHNLNILTQQTGALLRINQPGIATSPLAPAYFEARDEILASQRRLSHPAPSDGSFRTIPILAQRAARRAIAENPDHPDGYYALAQALTDRDLPMNEADRNIALMTAYRQCFIRLPPVSEYRRSFYLTSPTDVAINLAHLYLGQRLRDGSYQGVRVDSGSIGELAGGGVLYQLPAPPGTGARAEVLRVPPESIPRLPKDSVQMATGLYILPPKSFNDEHALPNKFFDFIVAGLAVAISPNPCMASIVRQYGVGVVADDYTPEAMAAALQKLTPEKIAACRAASREARTALNGTTEVDKVRALVRGLFTA